MDDYRDVNEAYKRRLEEIIKKAGLTLPDIYGKGGGEKVKKNG